MQGNQNCRNIAKVTAILMKKKEMLKKVMKAKWSHVINFCSSKGNQNCPTDFFLSSYFSELTSLLYIVGELAKVGYVALALGVSDK